MAVTETKAFEAILGHHRSMREEVAARLDVLRSAAGSAEDYEAPASDLVAFLVGEVLPHAMAEEATLYAAAGTHQGLGAAIEEMTREHRWLTSAVELLANAPSGPAALGEAQAIDALFAAHVAKENETILPALRAAADIDLAELLDDMHRRTEGARHGPSSDDGDPSSAGASPTGSGSDTGTDTDTDTSRALLSLLIAAADSLAAAGQPDRACRLAGSAWRCYDEPAPTWPRARRPLCTGWCARWTPHPSVRCRLATPWCSTCATGHRHSVTRRSSPLTTRSTRVLRSSW